MGGWGWLFGALVLVGVVLLVVVAVRLLGGGSGGGAGGVAGGGAPGPAPREDPRARARALLDERYARGEIDTDEYRERRQALDEGS
ncbi:SHOCT domain-containing protein [Blastococcus jejuensis]